ncbi:MAG: helix-turn-helix domain-containing protein [Caldilineaceae bacterium]|nr:helix-turn-helix domain-containing protein [Caldilineaceae bacterium]MDE0337875.1 helix-turn-helix domain-containing protein [Caldilineaceae bacterium]
MALYVRKLEEEEWEELERIIQSMENDVSIQRLMIILLSAQGHKVQEISREVDLHPINVRKWIHRYNSHGLDGLRSGKSPGRPPVFTAAQRQTIVEIASADPTSLKLPFSQWSLQRLRKHLIDEEVVDQISVETIRQILRAHGIQPRLMGSQHKGER